jgi:SnoaL-like protein
MSYDDALRRMLVALDRLEWDKARDCLADQVRVDFGSQSDSEPETIAADDLIARWRGVLPGFDVTQYLASPPAITHDERPGMLVDTDIAGYHHLGDEFWTVYGHCTARHEDDKITELTFQMSSRQGNADLPATAAKRAATSPRVLQD